VVVIVLQCAQTSLTPGTFYTCFYNHAHRPRLEKPSLLYLELPGHFIPLLDPGGDITFETAERRSRIETAVT
jgi:hypothetical protein